MSAECDVYYCSSNNEWNGNIIFANDNILDSDD